MIGWGGVVGVTVGRATPPPWCHTVHISWTGDKSAHTDEVLRVEVMKYNES